MSRPTQLAHSIIDDCAEAIVSTTLCGTIIVWNTAAQSLLGHTAREMLGRNVAQLIPAEQQLAEAKANERILNGLPTEPLHSVRLHKNGQRVPVVITLSPIRDKAQLVIGASFIMRVRDRTLRREQELLRMAYCDSLTGLANRVQLLDRLGQVMRRHERTRQYGAIYFIDLDDFKQVNDSAGHHMGDRILIKVARRLEANLREYDTIARWGGDEFVVLIEDLDSDFNIALSKAETIAANLLRVLRASYGNAQQHHCPPSMGVACFRGLTRPLTKAIDTADRAMYQAKASGKCRVHLDTKPLPDYVDGTRQAASAAA